MQHVIDWPGGEWMNKGQAVRALGIPKSMFERLLTAGVLSKPKGDNDRVRLWHWSEIYAVAQLWPRLMDLLEKTATTDGEKVWHKAGEKPKV